MYSLKNSSLTQDMCAAEEEKILCVIRDMVDAQNGGIKHSLNLPASMLVKNVIEEIAKLFNYVADTISVQYEKEPGIDSATVSAIGIAFNNI